MAGCELSSGLAAGLADFSAANISANCSAAWDNSKADLEDIVLVSVMQPAVVISSIMVLILLGILVARRGHKAVDKVLWHISGADYDLSDFVDKHPGGPVAIGLGRGIECTRLFRTYHAPGSIAHGILEKYRVSSAKPNPLSESDFQKDLWEMVQLHFKGQGKGAHKASYLHLATLTVLLVGVFASWRLWFAGNWISLLTLPVTSWLVAVNFSHDAGHFALSSKWWINHAVTFSSMPLLWNPLTWYSEHVVEHHCHTNNVDHDVDLFHFWPFRLHKGSTFTGSLANFAKLPLTCVHIGIIVPWNALTGLVDKYDPVGFPSGTHIKLLGIFRDNIWHYLSTWGSLLWAFASLFMSFFVHETLLKKVCFMLVPHSGAALLFIIFTQVSHIQEECQANETKFATDFFKTQATTSLDYSVDSYLWSFLSGGLNLQSLHHCLPWVNSCHYRALYPKFVEVCKKHGAQPPTVENLPGALNLGYNYVVKLNTQKD